MDTRRNENPLEPKQRIEPQKKNSNIETSIILYTTTSLYDTNSPNIIYWLIISMFFLGLSLFVLIIPIIVISLSLNPQGQDNHILTI